MSLSCRPTYTVFAGVNGVGKTTLYLSDLWKESPLQTVGVRINPDEIIRDNGWDWSNLSAQIKAGKECIRLFEDALAKGVSICQETTLSGKSSLMRIRRAAEAGYEVSLHYIGVQSPEIALARIAHRVEMGGHNIDEDLINQRWRISIANFSNALPYCTRACVYDNTTAMIPLLGWESGCLFYCKKISEQQGMWIIDSILDDEIWRKPLSLLG